MNEQKSGSVPVAGRPWLRIGPSLSPLQLLEPVLLQGSQRDYPQRAPATPGTRLSGAGESLDLQATFGVFGSDSLPLAQAGNSLHSIWATFFVRSGQLDLCSFTIWAHVFGDLRLGIEVESEIIPPLIFCFGDHFVLFVFLWGSFWGEPLVLHSFFGSQATREPLST